jgi:asparagine synthase (glutamine-hydrolysing)
LDTRDPTADRRLFEFCLSVPLEQYLHNGQRRALVRAAFADRLPRVVIEEKRKGYQAADWFEGLGAVLGDVNEELDHIAACDPARSVLDSARMKQLVQDWPAGGWEKHATLDKYRLALLRGLSAGHFVRKAAGSNQ